MERRLSENMQGIIKRFFARFKRNKYKDMEELLGVTLPVWAASAPPGNIRADSFLESLDLEKAVFCLYPNYFFSVELKAETENQLIWLMFQTGSIKKDGFVGR